MKRPTILAAAAVLLGGCSLLYRPPQRDYVSQTTVLAAVAQTSGYSPDAAAYRLRQAEVATDLLTFHYQGVRHTGDRAWVILFSQKTSEQSPNDLLDLKTLLSAVSEGKEGFQVTERGRRGVGPLTVDFARYRFRSPIRSQKGEAMPAGGIVALTRVVAVPAPLIYQLNVDNIEGDRPDIGWPEVLPLLEAIRA